MPEQVDRSVSPPTPAVPSGQNGSASAPEAGLTAAKSDPKQGPSRYEQRVEQLVREKYEMKSQLDQAMSRIAALEQTSRPSEPTRPPDQPITSVTQLADQTLLDIVRKGSESSADAFNVAYTELQRRAIEKAQAGASKQSQQLIDLERERLNVRSQITQTFKNPWDKAGELYQLADRYYGHFLADAKQKFGDEAGKRFVENQPNIEMRCFELAERELNAGLLNQLPDLQRKADRLKQIEALESGIGAPIQRDDAFRDALKRRDRRSVFRNLPSNRDL